MERKQPPADPKRLLKEFQMLQKIQASTEYTEGIGSVLATKLVAVVIEKLFQSHQVDFPFLPHIFLAGEGMDADKEYDFTQSHPLSDIFLAYSDFDLPVYILGSELEDREMAILDLPTGIQKEIRKRWVSWGYEVEAIEFDLVIQIPKLKKLYDMSMEGCFYVPDLEELFRCVAARMNASSYYPGCALLYSDDSEDGWIHAFYFYPDEYSCSLAKYENLMVFYEIYILYELSRRAV